MWHCTQGQYRRCYFWNCLFVFLCALFLISKLCKTKIWTSKKKPEVTLHDCILCTLTERIIWNIDCGLLVSVPQFKPWGSPKVGWKGSVCNRFPTFVHIVRHKPWPEVDPRQEHKKAKWVFPSQKCYEWMEIYIWRIEKHLHQNCMFTAQDGHSAYYLIFTVHKYIYPSVDWALNNNYLSIYPSEKWMLGLFVFP